MRVFFHWLFGIAVLAGMGVIGYQNPVLGVALLFGGAAGWLATQKGATATIRRYVSLRGLQEGQKARRREVKDQYSKLNKAEHEAIRLIILHGSILPGKVRDYLASEGFAGPETVIDSIRAKTSFLQGSFSGEFSINPSMKDLLEELVEEPLLAHPVIGYVGMALMLVAVLGCGYLFYTRVYPGKPRPSLIATTQPSQLGPLPSEVKPSGANPKDSKQDHTEQRQKTKSDNSTFSGNVTQGPGSIAQIGGAGNTATVTNNFLPPSRSINSQDRNDLVTGLSKKRAKAVVLYPISDNEAANFAQQIYDVLSDAGWELPDKMVRAVMLQGKFPPGVRIGFHGTDQPDKTEIEIPDDTLEGGVISMLLKAHIKNIYVNTRPQIAEGTIEFIVASNPESSPKPAEPKKPKTVPPAPSTTPPNDNSGSVGGNITQGPCSNLQIGGSNNSAAGGNCAPPARRLLPADRPKLISLLAASPGKVSILAPLGDNEAQQLGVDFYGTFKAAGWSMKDPIVMSFEQIGAPIPSDIIVFHHGEPVTAPTPIVTTLQPDDPVLGLKAFLVHTGFKFHFERRLGTPEGIIDVQIGPNPTQ